MKKQTVKIEWDFCPLFKSDNDPAIKKERRIIEEKSQQFAQKWRNRKDYLENPNILKEALDDYEEWVKDYEGGGKQWYYFHLRSEQDQLDPDLRAKFSQTQRFKQQIDNRMRFFYLSLSKITINNQKKLLKSPILKIYKHFLEKIFKESRHFLSEEEEKIISLKSIPAYENWVKMTSAFLSREERKILLEDGSKAVKTFTDIIGLVDSKNKKVRDSAAQAFNDILEKNSDIASEELNSILENKKIDDELRHIPHPDYDRHLKDDIETSIVNTLINSVSKHFDISHRYYELKAKMFKVKKLQYHERNIPYGKINKNYSYEQAVQLVDIVLSKLNKDFADIFKRYLENGQIDVYPKKGKRSGGFCAHYLISLPTFILINFNGKIEDVMTIAHEVGHGINNELMREKQNPLYFDTPLPIAEVASTFMEDFVLEEIMEKADDEQKLSIMMMRLNSDVSSIFRQISFYQFERQLHQLYREKGYLPKETIGHLFQENMAKYMGKSVEQSPGSENWWIYWIHLRYFFYVYSYVSGHLISKSLQSMVRKNPSSIEKVKGLLSAGTSDSPKNIFLKLGIDIADEKFWQKGLDEIEKLLNETTQLAKKLNKI